MIKNNKLIFGLGDIAVGNKMISNEITFQSFKPCAKIGSIVPKKVKFYGKKISIHLSIESYIQLKKSLIEVKEKKDKKFEFNGYIFDFSYYKRESIKVCIDHLNRAMNYKLLKINEKEFL